MAPSWPGLVGREPELAVTSRLFERALAGGAQVLLVEGEPGVGKTALVHVAAHQARQAGLRVLSATADELAGRRSFGLVTDALGVPALPRPGDLLDAAPPLAAASSAADTEFAASEAAIEVLERRCAAGPVALILEDLHWADRASLYVLRRIVRHTGDLPLAIVGTLRPLPRPAELQGLISDVGPEAWLPLRALTPVAVEELIAGAVGGAAGPQLRAQAAMAGGNPLFLLEMVDALRAEGALRSGPVVDVERATPVPSLRLTVLHRLSFLPAETVQLLGVAAVLGTRFRPAHLGRLANRAVGDLVRPLRSALATGLLTEVGDDLAFRHELVRDALYEDLPPAVRGALHREAARVLTRAGAPPGVVAEHLLRGTRAGDGEAVGELQAVARHLAGISPPVAVDLLERAVALAGPVPGLMADLGVALLWSGRAEEGEAACRRALAGLTDPAQRRLLRPCLAESLLHRGQAAAVVAEVEAARGDPGLDPLALARLDALAANARLFLGDVAGARADAEAAEAAGSALGDVFVRVRSLVVRGLLAEQAGRLSEAVEITGRAVELAGRGASPDVDELQPQLIHAMYLIDADRLEDAATLLSRAIAARQARHLLPLHHVCLGFSRFWAGRWDEAVAELETGIALSEEAGGGWRASARGLRAVVAVARGELDTAERWLAAAEAELAAGEAPYRTEWLKWARALWLEAKGRQEDAVDGLAGLGRAPGSHVALATVGPTAVRLARARNHPELAASVSSALGALANANPEVAGIAAASACVRGLLAGDADLLGEAADAYRRAGRPLEQALAAEAAALAAAGGGQRRRARGLVDQAVSLYRGLDAPFLADRLQRRLGFGELTGGRGRPATGWEALTAAELQIVRLVGERRTNPEIAATLGITRRTVETHITRILAKAGLRSRLQLAEAAARRFGWRLRLEQPAQDGEQA